jgi:hypothetical protein
MREPATRVRRCDPAGNLRFVVGSALWGNRQIVSRRFLPSFLLTPSSLSHGQGEGKARPAPRVRVRSRRGCLTRRESRCCSRRRAIQSRTFDDSHAEFGPSPAVLNLAAASPDRGEAQGKTVAFGPDCHFFLAALKLKALIRHPGERADFAELAPQLGP